ncbi:MAG: DUF4153 domain-containing protein [Alphaproteobacteria bacterium]|nr:DUF4153 domain-containing protein [Alphaproteobacteria bacterium]
MAFNVITKFYSVEALRETFHRFPLSVFCAASMFVIALLQVYEVIDLDEDIIARIFMILGSLYLWLGIVSIITESRKLSIARHVIIALLGSAGIGLLIAFSQLYWVNFFLILPTLLLCLTVAPYLSGGDDWSFWQFNRDLWIGVAISCLAAFLLCMGLTLALTAVHHLFDVEIDDKLYADIGLFSSMILGPVYALSRVPKKFDFLKEDCQIPSGLGFISNWISIPVVFVYLLILYAYFIKIVISGEMPSGHLAYMIAGFVGSGVVAYLIAWPLRDSDKGLPQLRLFYKIFFPALFIPIGFHFFAIWERIGAYGITEQRYVLIISAFWFLIVATAKTLPLVPIKIIPASLCVLLALASFGPWGAVSVSGKSQFMRLEKLLTENGLLKGWHIVALKDGVEISIEDRRSISSVLSYLCDTKREDLILPWFDDLETSEEDGKSLGCSPRVLTKKLGFEYVNSYPSGRYQDSKFYLSSNRENMIDIKGYDYMIAHISAHIFDSSDSKPWEQKKILDEHYDMDMFFDGAQLRLSIDDLEPVQVDITDYIKGKVGANVQISNLNAVAGENGDLFYKINFQYINGDIEEDIAEANNVTFDFLFRFK